MDHSRNSHEMFEGTLCKLLHHPRSDQDLVIYTLCATQKYIIQRRNFTGDKLPDYYLDAIRKLLKTKNPETKEWTLRTIDQMGAQGKKLANDILKVRPRFLSLLNKHNRNSHEIIEMLLKRWNYL